MQGFKGVDHFLSCLFAAPTGSLSAVWLRPGNRGAALLGRILKALVVLSRQPVSPPSAALPPFQGSSGSRWPARSGAASARPQFFFDKNSIFFRLKLFSNFEKI